MCARCEENTSLSAYSMETGNSFTYDVAFQGVHPLFILFVYKVKAKMARQGVLRPHLSFVLQLRLVQIEEVLRPFLHAYSHSALFFAKVGDISVTHEELITPASDEGDELPIPSGDVGTIFWAMEELLEKEGVFRCDGCGDVR